MIPNDPGIYYDVPFSDYVQIDAINNSTLKTMENKTPAHARHYQQYGRETQVFVFGRLEHVLLLEPNLFDSLYLVCTATNSNGDEIRRGTKAWNEFEELAQGREVIKPSQLAEAQATVEAIKRQRVHGYVSNGKSEVTLVWRDEEDVTIGGEHFPATGLLVKNRVDYAHEDDAILVDAKAMADTSPKRFIDRQIYDFGYHRQAAMACDGWERLTGMTPAFTFLVVEKCPGGCDPATWFYPAFVHETQPRTLDAGMLEYKRALRTWAQCVADDRWPAWDDQVYTDDMPDWRLKQIGIHDFHMI